MIATTIGPNLSQSWADRALSAATLSELGSGFVGVAPVHFEISYLSHEIRSHYVGVRAADAREALGAPVNRSNGGGSFNRTQAFIAGIAETVERYSAAFVPTGELIVGDSRQADVDPSRYALFAASQYDDAGFEFQPLTDKTRVSWTPAWDLSSGAWTYTPAQLVYLNRHVDSGTRIGYSTSSGLACGPNYSEALLSGLFEAVERDAVMIVWYARLSPPHVDLASDRRLAHVVERHLKPTGLNHVALDLTDISGIPTSLAVVTSPDKGSPFLSVGAAARPTLAEAAEEALIEAFHCTAYCRSLLSEQGPIPNSDHLTEDVKTLEDHVRFYGWPDNVRHAEFLTASSERSNAGQAPSLNAASPKVLIEGIVNRLAKQQVTCLAVDTTSPDIAEAGLSVVKAICPELIPLSVGWLARYLGGARILKIPRQLPYGRQITSMSDLNPYPHPFP